MSGESQSEFEKLADERRHPNLIAEFLGFLKHNKKWWLLPILLVLIAFGVLMIFTGTAAAPFIYTLF
jgi:hypothetical protein